MLRLRLLGAPSVADGVRELYLPAQKAQALLFYLAAEAERSFSRSQVIALLWEDSSEREGRNSLSTALTRLRQALPLFPVRAEGDTLAWQPSADVWADVHEFQAAAQPPPAGAEPLARRIERLEQAAGLYRGSFLDGFGLRDSLAYDEWLRLERERWQQRWLNVADQLIEAYSAASQWDRALGYARAAMNADPLQERFHRALMRLHYQAGDRAAALAQFRACRDVLDRELGVEPDPETAAMEQAIANGTLERGPRALALPAAPPPVPHVPTTRLAARLAAARRRSFVGRGDQLAIFAAALAAPEPPFAVLHLHGPGGVGKSTLLSEFAHVCAEAQVQAVMLDGRNLQPTPDGFFAALAGAVGAENPLEALPERYVLLIDTYELITPLDTWLRDQFLPQISDKSMVVLAGRNPPGAGWRADPGWQEISQVMQLGNLSEADAADYLQRRNVASEQRAAVLKFTRGYPLALSLAAEVLIQRPGQPFVGSGSPDIVRALLERLVASVPSVAHRAALEACSQVRVLSEPLLAAMLDAPEARELFDWVRDLSFVSSGPRGIFPHDLAREALAADLKWRNPPWYHELHRRARAFYMALFERSHGHDQHLALLDLIFLHDNPLIRSTFSWNSMTGMNEEAPTPADWPVLLDMVRRHEGERSAAVAARWFSRQPQGVQVFRDSSGRAMGFNCFVTLHPEEREWSAFDPCAQAIWRFLDTCAPLEPGQLVTVDRFWMDTDAYQALSPTQGMVFVSATRYVLTTPGLAYTFYVWRDADVWRQAAEQVLFQRLPEVDFAVGQQHFCVFMRDWLTLPTTAWLEALAERETE